MRPILQLLSPEEVGRVVDDALQVLRTVGMFVENDDALTLAREGGLRVVDGRVYPGEKAVRAALDSAPATVTLYDREGDTPLEVGGTAVHFDPGSAALYVYDEERGGRRKGTVRDAVHLSRITQACRNIELQATGVVPADIADQFADRFRLYLALCNCRKPVVTGTFVTEAFAVMKEMLVAVRGSEQALRQRPLAIFDCAPTPPLKWSNLTCQALIDSARAGIPAQLVSMPMAGATGPVTLRDTVTQLCAENLCGVVLHQLAGPGAPIIFGGSPSALDMRHGTTPMGAIETMMIDASYAQVGHQLGLPTQAYMGLSDAKTPDWQAGAEDGIGVVLAALAGVNVVSGPGMLDFESCQSLEKLVLDDQACGMALRLVRGVGHGASETSAETVALIEAVVAAGHFLSHPHTRQNFRQQLLIPGPAIDRGSHGAWEKRGSPSAFEAATAQVKETLARGNPAPLDDELKKELDRLISEDARRCGVELPAVALDEI